MLLATSLATSLALLALLALLATAVVAGPLVRREPQVTNTIVSDLDFYAQYASAAYCNYATPARSPVTCRGNCPDVERNNVTVATSFFGVITGMGGFIATDHARKAIIMSFQGTHSIRNWIANIMFAFDFCSDLGQKCKVHTGFRASWDEISAPALAGLASARAANPSYTVIATGHSLGGAVANFAATTIRVTKSMPVTVYSYGSPRVGNDAYANLATAQTASGILGSEYRVTHIDDPVPRLPPLLFGYRHTSPELWLSSGAATTVEYDAKDIKVCQGSANLACNGGRISFDVDAHYYYLLDVCGCSDGKMEWKRGAAEADDDAELADKAQKWAELDLQYAASLSAGVQNQTLRVP